MLPRARELRLRLPPPCHVRDRGQGFRLPPKARILLLTTSRRCGRDGRGGSCPGARARTDHPAANVRARAPAAAALGLRAHEHVRGHQPLRRRGLLSDDARPEQNGNPRRSEAVADPAPLLLVRRAHRLKSDDGCGGGRELLCRRRRRPQWQWPDPPR